MSELLLGIDMGTGSSKGILATPEGAIVATAVRAHGMSLPRPGWAEVDAENVWWKDVVALCRELTDQADGDQVAAVCVSGVGPCLLLCDEDVRPVRPAILYGIDMRATAEIEELTHRFGEQRILERCG
jgi:xylulokinase